MQTRRELLAILEELREAECARWEADHGLRLFCGDWMDSAVLKLHKGSWSEDGHHGKGLFFSVWADDTDVKKKRLRYNLHAFGLRLWKTHVIKPKAFASEFRDRFQLLPSAGAWPHLELSYGPQTLLQGWTDLDSSPEQLRSDVLGLMTLFTEVAPLLDAMLEEWLR